MTEGTKYHPLFERLLFSGQGSITMSFAEIEAEIGAPLPPSARKREEWWSNNPSGHSQARAWLRASYRAGKVDLARESVTFVLDGWPEKFRGDVKPPFIQRLARGMEQRAQERYDPPKEKKPDGDADHPLFGIWKGKVTLLADHDYTKPAFEIDDPS